MKRKVEITLAAWVDGYIQGRTDIKPNTKRNMLAARKKRLINENPLDGVPTGTVSNPKRQQSIRREDIQKVLDACPDNE